MTPRQEMILIGIIIILGTAAILFLLRDYPWEMAFNGSRAMMAGGP